MYGNWWFRDNKSLLDLHKSVLDFEISLLSFISDPIRSLKYFNSKTKKILKYFWNYISQLNFGFVRVENLFRDVSNDDEWWWKVLSWLLNFNKILNWFLIIKIKYFFDDLSVDDDFVLVDLISLAGKISKFTQYNIIYYYYYI